jgi:hypothetical protein
MEVEVRNMDSNAQAGADNDNNVGFTSLVESIKTLEQRSKGTYSSACLLLSADAPPSTAKEQLLTETLAKERAQWQEEKEALMTELRLKEEHKTRHRYVFLASFQTFELTTTAPPLQPCSTSIGCSGYQQTLP